jgi:hypothetical protein
MTIVDGVASAMQGNNRVGPGVSRLTKSCLFQPVQNMVTRRLRPEL